MAEIPQSWIDKTYTPNPPPLVGGTPDKLGPLPGSQPQPAFTPKRPGFEPIFIAILQSFVRQTDPRMITDELMDLIIRQSVRFADKILDNYPEMKGLVPK